MNGFKAIQKEHQHIISNIKYLNLSSKIFKIYSNLSKPGELWHSGLIPWISWDFLGVSAGQELIIGDGGENIAPVPIEDHVKAHCDGINEAAGTGFQLRLLGLSVSSWG